MSIHRSRGRAGVLALAAVLSVPVALAMAGPAAAAAPGPAAAAPCKVVRVGKAGSTANLQAAITAAPAKAVLIVTGTCRGSFIIDKDLTIKKGAKPATLKGNGGRVLQVTAGSVVLSGLRITGGTAQDCGGAGSMGCGGGILNKATLKLVGVTVSGNTADGGTTLDAFGGGIVNFPDATLRIVRSTLSGNEATGGSGSAYGGALHNEDGTVTISRSRITGNRADATSAFGGAISHGGGTMTIGDTTVSGNVATGTVNISAGGIGSGGVLVIRRSLIAGNVAATAAGEGGGITANSGSTLTVTDSTITGNRAGRGGGIDVGNVVGFTVLGSTIARNTATVDEGGGIAGDWTMNVGSTIIARNSAPVSPDCAMSAPTASLGHNLVGNNKDCNGFVNGVNNDRVGTDASPLDPKLGKLLANGGPTRTLALLAGSPAINKAGNAPCATTKDQRGVKRPQLGKCDIGAYEKR